MHMPLHPAPSRTSWAKGRHVDPVPYLATVFCQSCEEMQLGAWSLGSTPQGWCGPGHLLAGKEEGGMRRKAAGPEHWQMLLGTDWKAYVWALC